MYLVDRRQHRGGLIVIITTIRLHENCDNVVYSTWVWGYTTEILRAALL